MYEKLLKSLMLILVISIPVTAIDITKDAIFTSSNIDTTFNIIITDGGTGMSFTGIKGQTTVTPSGQTDSNPWATISNGNAVQNFDMAYTSHADAPSWLKINDANDISTAVLLNSGDTKSIPGGTNVAPNSDIKLFLWTTYTGTISVGQKTGSFVVNGTTTAITPAALLAKIQPLLIDANKVNPTTPLVRTQDKQGPIYVYRLPGTNPEVLIVQTSGAIDCDGQETAQCNPSTDDGYQNQTSFEQSNGQPLIASILPYYVLPVKGSQFFDYSKNNIDGGQLGAILYSDKMNFGVFGDEDGTPNQIGEISYAMASSLGINSDPNHGGVSNGVTFIIFTDSGNIVDPIEDHSKAVSMGDTAISTLYSQLG